LACEWKKPIFGPFQIVLASALEAEATIAKASTLARKQLDREG
jgi:hypothetical protein